MSEIKEGRFDMAIYHLEQIKEQAKFQLEDPPTSTEPEYVEKINRIVNGIDDAIQFLQQNS